MREKKIYIPQQNGKILLESSFLFKTSVFRTITYEDFSTFTDQMQRAKKVKILVTGEAVCALISGYLAVRAVSNVGTEYECCYTSWGEATDIIRTDTPTSASSIAPNFPPSAGIDGLACGRWSCTSVITPTLANSHVQFDLINPTRIHKIIVVPRNPNRFEDILLYLGNSTDFHTDPIFFQVKYQPLGYVSIEIEGNRSIAGRYLTFYRSEAKGIGFCEFQVIPVH